MNIGKKIAEQREYRKIEKSLESYFAEVAKEPKEIARAEVIKRIRDGQQLTADQFELNTAQLFILDCIEKNQWDLVHQALNAGYPLDHINTESGYALIHWLTELLESRRSDEPAYLEALHLLVRRGASLEIKDTEGTMSDSLGGAGMTGLLHACQLKFTRAVSLLTQAGADIHAVDSDGLGALHFAVDHGLAPLDENLVEYLLKAGVDPTRKDDYGDLPIDALANDDDPTTSRCRRLLSEHMKQRGFLWEGSADD
jgi:ankyrin repeat protein